MHQFNYAQMDVQKVLLVFYHAYKVRMKPRLVAKPLIIFYFIATFFIIIIWVIHINGFKNGIPARALLYLILSTFFCLSYSSLVAAFYSQVCLPPASMDSTFYIEEKKMLHLSFSLWIISLNLVNRLASISYKWLDFVLLRCFCVDFHLG